MQLKFHRFATDKSFRSSADFAEYADKQKRRFAALEKDAPQDYQHWGRSLERHWSSASSRAKDHPEDPAAIQSNLKQFPVFAFDSALSRKLSEMVDQSRGQAAEQIMPFLTGNVENQRASNANWGQLAAHSEFRLCLTLESTVRSSKYHPIDEQFADHEKRLSDMLDGDRVEIEKLRADFSEMLQESHTKHEDVEEDARKFLADANAQWMEAYASYVDQLATETAVELWSNRADKHEVRYKSFRSWVIGFGLSGLVLSVTWIFGGFALAKWAFEDDATAQLASYTAGSIALFTLLVWGLRVLIRSMMSEDHLSTDASARSALAHTYLALTKEEAATDKDRAIILAALFAPVSDGLVKDDGMPAFSPAAMATRTLTNPS